MVVLKLKTIKYDQYKYITYILFMWYNTTLFDLFII